MNVLVRGMVSYEVQETQDKIGGPGIVVEIDESKFGRRKYNRRHHVGGAWVFGGVERTPERKVFAQVVSDRTAETLLSAIEQNIHPESIIFSDMWRSYFQINNVLGMEHRMMNHSQNYVDSQLGTYTNTIEGTWNGIKIKIPPRNRTKSEVSEHLFEFIWRRQHKENLWDSFLNCLKNGIYLDY